MLHQYDDNIVNIIFFFLMGRDNLMGITLTKLTFDLTNVKFKRFLIILKRFLI